MSEENNEELDEQIIALKISNDMKQTLRSVTPVQARFLVDGYQAAQKRRLAVQGQIRSMTEEPAGFLEWVMEQCKIAERQYAIALRFFADGKHMGRWAMGIRGCGPITAAALVAHIDITKAPTAGHIWSYAGFNPNMEWGKGKKRPFNMRLKIQCRNLADCFIKSKSHPDSYYGKLYEQRKAYETALNESGAYAEQAAKVLERVGKTTECAGHNKKGMLSPGHIHSRAMRWTVKMFLAHWHAEAYREHYNQEPPLPYPIAHLDHVHYLNPPKIAV